VLIRGKKPKKLKALNEISYDVIGAAFRVHSELGPGLLESTYEACLAYELGKLGLAFERQKSLPVTYQDVQLDAGYRIDLLVEDRIILEIKSVEAIAPIHKAQLMTYLKLSGIKLGLLLNFNVQDMKKGINRIIM
jgi:GxxExxY protein